MEFLKALSTNQEYWNMQLAQAAVTVRNYEIWYVIQAIVVALYVSLLVLYFIKGDKLSYDTREALVFVFIGIGLFVGLFTLFALCSIGDYNMAKYNPDFYVLKQIVRHLP